MCVRQSSSDLWFSSVSLACSFSHWWYFMKKRFPAHNSSRLNKSTWACYSYLMPPRPAGNLSQLSSLNASHFLKPYCKKRGEEGSESCRETGGACWDSSLPLALWCVSSGTDQATQTWRWSHSSMSDGWHGPPARSSWPAGRGERKCHNSGWSVMMWICMMEIMV